MMSSEQKIKGFSSPRTSQPQRLGAKVIDNHDPPEISADDYRRLALEKAIKILKLKDRPLEETKKDKEYQQYLLSIGVLREKVPERYTQYLNRLLKCIVEENPPYDPWIQAWVEDRAVISGLSINWNPEWNLGKVSSLQKPGQAAQNDFISFGKRASVMDFTYLDDGDNSKIKAQLPSRSWPTVLQVMRDPEYTKPPDGIRWIHLPANNMSWVEVRLFPWLRFPPDVRTDSCKSHK
jgi:hypothetical protein